MVLFENTQSIVSLFGNISHFFRTNRAMMQKQEIKINKTEIFVCEFIRMIHATFCPLLMAIYFILTNGY
jgi:hypothetical protein